MLRFKYLAELVKKQKSEENNETIVNPVESNDNNSTEVSNSNLESTVDTNDNDHLKSD